MNTPDSSDAELLSEFHRSGCEWSFEQLVTRYSPLVKGVALRVLGNQADAEDSAQATFLALALKTPKIDEQGRLGPWLHTVAVRAALDLKKSSLRRLRRHEALSGHDGGVVDDVSHQSKIDEAIGELPPKLRRTLVQHYLEGRSIEEISKIEACSTSAVSMRLTRSREILRRRLGEGGLQVLIAGAGVTAAATVASAREIASVAVQALRGFRILEPSLDHLMEAARRAMRPSWREILRPAATFALWLVIAGIVATPIVAGQNLPAAKTSGKPPLSVQSTAVESSNPSVNSSGEHPLLAAAKKYYNWEDMNAFTRTYEPYKKDLNTIRDSEGRTALHLASIKGHQEFTALMLINGADINQPDNHGYTPLFYAVQGKNVWIIMLFILKGADVNHIAKDGSTPLGHAVRSGDVHNAEVLLWTGAKPVQDQVPAEWQPAKLAHDSENPGMAEIIDAYSQPKSPVFADPTSGLPAFVRNPLHDAARRGDFPMLEQLLRDGPGPNVRDEKGRTALHEAVSVGQADVVFYLLMMGADPNAVDNEGRSPLSATMGWLGGGLDAMRRFLFVAGANPNALRKDGYTELTWAVKRDNEHGAQWLLWLGVDPRQQTAHGTPFEIAVREGNQRQIDLLRRNGVDGEVRLSNDPAWLLQNASRRGDIAMIKEALKAGAKIDEVDEEGNTPAMQAIFKRQVPAARYLLEAGADLEFANAKSGWTPLFATVVWDFPDMTKLREEMLESGANPNVASDTGETPLMRSLWYHPCTPLKQLIEHGADLNARDKKGRTALRRAIEDGKPVTADYLRARGAKE